MKVRCPHQDLNLDWTRSERIASTVGLQGPVNRRRQCGALAAGPHEELGAGVFVMCTPVAYPYQDSNLGPRRS
jgi:hypothetical protein